MKLSALCQGAESDLHSAYVAVLANEALHWAKNQPQIKATVGVCLSQRAWCIRPHAKGCERRSVDRQPELIRVLTIHEVVDRGVLAFRNADAECRWWHACFDCMCASMADKT